MTGGGGADLIFRFQLKRGGDGMKYCRKMKRSQRARLDSIGRKRDTVRRRGNVAGGDAALGKERKREETMPIRLA
jgi:hypothetical protein